MSLLALPDDLLRLIADWLSESPPDRVSLSRTTRRLADVEAGRDEKLYWRVLQPCHPCGEVDCHHVCLPFPPCQQPAVASSTAMVRIGSRHYRPLVLEARIAFDREEGTRYTIRAPALLLPHWNGYDSHWANEFRLWSLARLTQPICQDRAPMPYLHRGFVFLHVPPPTPPIF